MSTLRDEDITTTPNATFPGPGDADDGDSSETQIVPPGAEPTISDTADADGTDGGGDADSSDSSSTQADPAGVDPTGSDADSSDGSDADGTDS